MATFLMFYFALCLLALAAAVGWAAYCGGIAVLVFFDVQRRHSKLESPKDRLQEALRQTAEKLDAMKK